MGATVLNEAQFGAYFDNAVSYWKLYIEDVTGADHDVTGCGFSRDIGQKFLFDEDILLVIWLTEPVPVRQIVAMSTLRSEDSAQAIFAACADRGILQANVMFVYANPTLEIPNPAGLFNGIPFIGRFAEEAQKKTRRSSSQKGWAKARVMRKWLAKHRAQPKHGGRGSLRPCCGALLA
ncbi:immunity 22 family protein [Brucella anthropi]|nr:immunity 22 family protein [Ochrobactrum sp. MYb49]